MRDRIPQRKHQRHLLGDLPDFQTRPLDLMLELANEYPPLTKIRFGPVAQYVVSDPDAAKYVLQQNNRNYIKEQQMMTVIRSVLKSGRNLFSSDGEAWLQRRRMMQPTFHRKLVAEFSTLIVEEATRVSDSWQEGQAIDIEHAMMEATMSVIGRTMLTRDILTDHPQLYHAFLVASEYIIHRATTLQGRFTPTILPTAQNRAFKQALDTIRNVLAEAVQTRQLMPPQARPTDLLTLLMAGRDDESGFTLSAEQLMDELYGIVTAGHETSSIVLATLFYELANHQAVADRVQAELDSVLQGRLPSVTDIPQLPYLENVINEALRRYPAAYVTSRQAIDADEVLGYAIPKGGTIIVNIYGLHHHNTYWRDPMSFDPERWTRDDINSDAFLPFGAGPRKCIGEPLARLEMVLIAATILQRVRFRLLPERLPVIRARFTLRAEDGIWLIPTPRQPS